MCRNGLGEGPGRHQSIRFEFHGVLNFSLGDVARMADPSIVEKIQKAVSIPVMAKVRIGHFVEAMILEHLQIDFIDESEVLTPADPFFHIEKRKFKVPFVCGCKTLKEALGRINEGAAMIRTKVIYIYVLMS